MCCLITTLLFAGPRMAIILWWLFAMERWESAFDSFIVPFLGFFLLPWTTLMYVAVAPTGDVSGIDWFWLAIAFIADLMACGGGAYGNKDRYTRSGYGPTPTY
jgi:hypothetical protein